MSTLTVLSEAKLTLRASITRSYALAAELTESQTTRASAFDSRCRGWHHCVAFHLAVFSYCINLSELWDAQLFWQ